MTKKLNNKGFTIVELVIVIAVIAILSAVLIPTFSNVIENARSTANLQEAKNELDSYVAFCAAQGQPLNDGVVFVVEDNDGNELAYYAYYKGGLHEFSFDEVKDKNNQAHKVERLYTLTEGAKLTHEQTYDFTSQTSVKINGIQRACSHEVSYFINSDLAKDGIIYTDVDGSKKTVTIAFAYEYFTPVVAEGNTTWEKAKWDENKDADIRNDDGSMNVKIYGGTVNYVDVPQAG